MKPLTASEKVMVTLVVSPTVSAVSATTMLAVGRTVSIVKLAEFVVPIPAFPAQSVRPELFRMIRLLESRKPTFGVKTPIQVMPPSLLLNTEIAPFGIDRSSAVKPVTASEKVIVTSEVSPAFKAVSAMTIVAVGLVASTT